MTAGRRLALVGRLAACVISAGQSIESRHISLGHIPPTFFPPGQYPSHQGYSPAGKAKISELALTRTPDPNRSTAINFVHLNGSSLNIVDSRMVAVDGRNVRHHVKREGGICPGGMPGCQSIMLALHAPLSRVSRLPGRLAVVAVRFDTVSSRHVKALCPSQLTPRRSAAASQRRNQRRSY